MITTFIITIVVKKQPLTDIFCQPPCTVYIYISEHKPFDCRHLPPLDASDSELLSSRRRLKQSQRYQRGRCAPDLHCSRGYLAADRCCPASSPYAGGLFAISPPTAPDASQPPESGRRRQLLTTVSTSTKRC